ncbi:hypothetical protein SNL152K_1906 [Streptomyces sp. NL15-2K]|nr:hypothetical protein SNL152K_1906 [Streptomyces sp. NL15-2K]
MGRLRRRGLGRLPHPPPYSAGHAAHSRTAQRHTRCLPARLVSGALPSH